MSTDPADAELAALADPAPPASADRQVVTAADRPVNEPMYPSLPRWVADWLAPTLRRPDRQEQAWCPQWWRHAEAICRLEALWRSWERLRLDGTVGMSVWWRDHADYHLRQLCDGREGPFAKCRGAHKGESPPLPVEEPPPGWFGSP